MKALLFVLALAMVACTPGTAPPGKTGVLAPAVSAPVDTRPAAESAARVSQSVDKASTKAASTSEELDKASKYAAEAFALSSENTAMRAALDQVVASLTAARSNNGELLKELSTLKAEKDNLNTSLVGLSNSVAAKEIEVTGLRLALKQANKDLAASAETIEALNKSNASLIKEAASAAVYKHWVLGLSAVNALFIIGWIYLKALKPL